MKRAYELAIILRLDPNEQVMRDAIDQVQQWIEGGDNGTVKKIDHWGRRKLAYEIDKQREGYYLIMDVDIEAAHIVELERNLKLSNDIIRYLLVRPD
ncbi:MAG: 30S ribosomal protein S6 [Anaerolineae bacterium]